MKALKIISNSLCYIVAVFSVTACKTIPTGVEAVCNFEKEKYLGTWYEIARFDFRFERDLNNTTATYTINDDGIIKVDNKGYNYKTKQWKRAIGKAKFVGYDSIAMLKVSFFGPFYAGYNVIAIDADYKYALVAGDSFDYLWILSRETTIPAEIKQAYILKAQTLGFNISQLIWVEHNN